MDTKMKSNTVVSVGITEDGSGMTFAVKGAGSVTLTLGMVSAAVKARAAIHGLKQRVSDAAAQSRDSATGASASPEVKLAAIKRLVDHYNSGSEDWSPARVEGGGVGLDGMILAAVMEATGRDEAAVREMVAAGATKHGVTPRVYLAKLGTSKSVEPILTRMRAQALPEVDAEDDIAAMMAQEG